MYIEEEEEEEEEEEKLIFSNIKKFKTQLPIPRTYSHYLVFPLSIYYFLYSREKILFPFSCVLINKLSDLLADVFSFDVEVASMRHEWMGDPVFARGGGWKLALKGM